MKRTLALISLCVGATIPVLLAGAAGVTPAAMTQQAQASPLTDPGRRGAPPLTGTGLILGQVVDAGTGQPIADVVVSPGRSGGAPRMSAPGTLGKKFVEPAPQLSM